MIDFVIDNLGWFIVALFVLVAIGAFIQQGQQKKQADDVAAIRRKLDGQE